MQRIIHAAIYIKFIAWMQQYSFESMVHNCTGEVCKRWLARSIMKIRYIDWALLMSFDVIDKYID